MRSFLMNGESVYFVRDVLKRAKKGIKKRADYRSQLALNSKQMNENVIT